MEDSLEKLTLMRKYDFSKLTGEHPRYFGFSNALFAGVHGGMSVFSRREKALDLHLTSKEEQNLFELNTNILSSALDGYGYACACYASIDFSELDSEDEDFKPLFTIRDLLPDLGKAINDLMVYPIKFRESGDITGTDEYKFFQNIVTKIQSANDPLIVIELKN